MPKRTHAPRQELADKLWKRGSYIATFIQEGWRYGQDGLPERTVLLRDVQTPKGRPLCDHVWVVGPDALMILSLDLDRGDWLYFSATVVQYVKKGSFWRKGKARRVFYEKPDYQFAHFEEIKRVEAPCH